MVGDFGGYITHIFLLWTKSRVIHFRGYITHIYHFLSFFYPIKSITYILVGFPKTVLKLIFKTSI